ncbi:MAG: hypothetical protein U0946_02055 [Patescibacteria group bacterium]|nr:hypothetical protein [Patescibacteria group bacterium]
MLKKLITWIEKNEGLILILLLVVILRIPSLFEPYWYGDEGIYLVLGQAFRKGLVFYRDIHDNKPPLLYLLAAISGNVFYFRLMLMIWFGAGTAAFFKLMQVVLPKKKLAWYGATLAMIILTTLFEGNVANAEIFIVLPVILAMLMVVNKTQHWFGVGLLFSAGFLFKVPAAFDFAALIIWLMMFEKNSLRKILAMGFGFILPILGTIIYYGVAGGLEPYVRSALLQNIGYLTSWQPGQTSAGQGGLMQRAVIIAGYLVIFYPLAKKFKFSKWVNLSVIWFLLAMFGALLSERPYPHYLIQPVVPGTILLALFIYSRQKWLKLVIVTLGILSGWWWYQIKFWGYPMVPYYINFAQYITHQKSLEEYRNYFDPRVNQTYRLGEYLKKTTLPQDRVFIWGDEPGVYALAERLPVGRYTVAYHVVDFDGYKATMLAWGKQPPRVVLVMDYEKRPFKEMELILATDYILAGKIDQARVYRLLEGK